MITGFIEKSANTRVIHNGYARNSHRNSSGVVLVHYKGVDMIDI